MRIPTIRGIIERRILANFRIDPEVMARNLPAPFRPKIVNGYAIGGICLIRLKAVRPRFIPFPWGIRSENAAHRIAALWTDEGHDREGVYIPRRDTDSRINALAGGRLFPGLHHHARFKVDETRDRFSVALQSDDGVTKVSVIGQVAEQLPGTSVFHSMEEASRFFEGGSLGYSVTRDEGRYDGLELRCRRWEMQPLNIEQVESSYFEDESRFPKGSVSFDCALLVRNIDHEWLGREDLCCSD